MDGVNWARANWDRLTGWSLAVGGAVLLLIGSVRVASAGYLADQLSFLMSAGVGGLGAIVLGSAMLITASLHDEWRKLDRLETAVRQTSGVELATSLTEPEAAPESSVADRAVATVRPVRVALHYGAGQR